MTNKNKILHKIMLYKAHGLLKVLGTQNKEFEQIIILKNPNDRLTLPLTIIK